jgi:hypothetical protein
VNGIFGGPTPGWIIHTFLGTNAQNFLMCHMWKEQIEDADFMCVNLTQLLERHIYTYDWLIMCIRAKRSTIPITSCFFNLKKHLLTLLLTKQKCFLHTFF